MVYDYRIVSSKQALLWICFAVLTSFEFNPELTVWEKIQTNHKKDWDHGQGSSKALFFPPLFFKKCAKSYVVYFFARTDGIF